MDFKVNWDDKVWGITVFVTALLIAAVAAGFIFFHGIVSWIIAGVAVATLLVNALMSPVKLRITSTGIVLFKIFGKKVFLYRDMESISLCDIQTSPNIRLIGCGGVMGYTGLFYNKSIGRFTSYVGSMFRTVLIRMNNGKQYVVSCLNPDKLVEICRANLRATKNGLQK